MKRDDFFNNQNPKESRVVVAGICVLASLMLLYAIFEYPPYGYFIALKVVVALGSVMCAYALWKQSKYFAPLSLLLLAIGAVHTFGKMHRQEWEFFNWSAIALFATTTVATLGPPIYRWCLKFLSERLGPIMERGIKITYKLMLGVLIAAWIAHSFFPASFFPSKDRAASPEQKMVLRVLGDWISADQRRTLNLHDLEDRHIAQLTVKEGNDSYECVGKWKESAESVTVQITGQPQCQYVQELVPVGTDYALAPIPVSEARFLDAWFYLEDPEQEKRPTPAKDAARWILIPITILYLLACYGIAKSPVMKYTRPWPLFAIFWALGILTLMPWRLIQTADLGEAWGNGLIGGLFFAAFAMIFAKWYDGCLVRW